MQNELRSELCLLHLPDNNGSLGSSHSGWLYKEGGVGWGGSHSECPQGQQEPSAGQSRVSWRDSGSGFRLFAGCWHAGVHMHVCNSNRAHTTLCCQKIWGNTEGREETLWWGLKFREGEKAEGLARAQRKWRRRYCVPIEMGHIEDSFRPCSEPGSHRAAASGHSLVFILHQKPPFSPTPPGHGAQHGSWLSLSLQGFLCWGAVALFLQVFQEDACPLWISSLAPGSVSLGEAGGLMSKALWSLWCSV